MGRLTAPGHERFMRAALLEAERASQAGDVPVGAAVVCDGELISVGRNRRELDGSAIAHAEIEAITAACAALKSWRLERCDLYVTLEPCPMCAGALINARVRRVIIGAPDPKAGACGSVLDLFAFPFNHKPQVILGVLESECAALLSGFFERLRDKKSDPQGLF